LAARAAEGLLRAEVVRAAERDAEGRARAAAIGAGEQIMHPGNIEPVVFDVADEWSQYAVDAAVRAVLHAGRALLPPTPDARHLEEVEAELSEVVFEVLDPVRTALRAGADARELVPRVDVSPYRAEGGDAPATRVLKKPAHALLAALVLPVGGGHHFAEHHHLGAVLSVAIVASFAGSMLRPSLLPAALLMVLADALLAPGATRRRNRGDIPSPRWQLACAAVIVAAALLAAVTLGA
jgi:hypothetical protein